MRSTYKMMGLKGVNQLSLQDVADDAGISKALVLYHFGSKEQLILTTIHWVLDRVAQRIRDSISTVEAAETMTAIMIDAIFIDPELNRHFYLIFCDILGYAARVDSFGAVSLAFRDTVNQMYAEVIARGVREQSFRVADITLAAGVVRAIIDGLFIQWLQEKDWRERHATYRELCKESVLAYLRAPSPPARP